MSGPDGLDPDVAQGLETVTREIVDATVQELGSARLSAPMRLLAQAALHGLRRGRDYDGLITQVERLTDQYGEVTAIHQRCLSALLGTEEEVARRNPGSDPWWNTRARPVSRALSLGQPDQALRLLARIWVDGLAMQDWPHCRWVLEQREFPPEAARTLARMRAVTEALADEDHAAALDPLDGLLDSEGPDADRIDQGAAVRLGVLRTRILQREFSDRGMIRHSALDAVDRAAGSEWSSLALAVLAETQLAADEVEAARATLAHAESVDRPSTDALVVSGLLLERDGFWALADQSYDRAVRSGARGGMEHEPAAIHPALLRPIPPRLLVRAALSGTAEGHDALDLLDRALAEGIAGEDDHPEREVHLARAEKLLDLAEGDQDRGCAAEAEEHRVDAARSLVEAGRRYSWSGLGPQAAELFRRACDLAPDVAEFRWALAEQLRLDAWRIDGTVDLAMLQEARDQMELGLDLRSPGSDEAWVLVTQAMIGSALSDGHQDTSALVERALLEDPSYTPAYGFLARLLRRQGLVTEAFEASTDGREHAGATDSVLLEEHLNLLLDRGLYDQALRFVERLALRLPDDDGLAVARADVLLRLRRFSLALAALSGRSPTDSVRLMRGHCLFAAGDVEASQEEFRSLWEDVSSGPAVDVAGWAAFRAGLLDEGIARFRELRISAPASMPFTRDLGQMLLVRGEVAEGAALIAAGIAASPYVAELRHLAAGEFDFVRHATAEAPHGAEVADVLTELGRRIDRRCAELLGARRPGDDVAAMLGAARLAAHTGRPLDALVTYAALAGDDDVPEAFDAAVRAGWSALGAADELFTRQEHDAARDQWSAVERALVEASADADPGLLQSLACRRMLTDLTAGSEDQVAAWLSGVAGAPGLPEALTRAARTLAYDAAHLWAVRDRLVALSERDDVTPGGREAVVRAARGLPFDSAYHLRAAEADTQGSTFLVLNPLELRFGASVEDLCRSDELARATSELGTRIETEMGVRVPSACTVAAPDLPDRRVDMYLYAHWIGSTVLPEARADRLTELVTDLEERVRGNLFRLVGVDDVASWLEGWEPRRGGAPAWVPTDPRADRLRLARVLRMLLREQVSVRDRATIVAAVRSPDGVDTRHESATLNTLLDIRRRLGRAALGVGTETVVVPLPRELEERVAAGLPEDRPVWELPRAVAHRLVADLRAWLRSQPVVPGAICVADGRVRPFVWRLVAAERPAVHVLSGDELT